MKQSPPKDSGQEKGPGLVDQSNDPSNARINYNGKDYPEIEFTLGIDGKGQPQSKIHRKGPDGKVKTIAPNFSSCGVLRHVRCTLDALPEQFGEPGAFMILGTPKGSSVGETRGLTLAAFETGNAIARTAANFEFAAGGTYPLFIDVDIKSEHCIPPMPSGMRPMDVLKPINSALKSVGAEGLTSMAIIARSSSSAGITFEDGTPAKDSDGWHIFLALKGKTPNQVLGFLHKQLVIRGFGYAYVEAKGAVDIRTYIDAKVGGTNRVSFQAPPILKDGLKRNPKFDKRPGRVLDLTDVDLTVDESEFEARCDALKSAPGVKELIAERRAAYVEKQFRRGVAGGLSEEQARNLAKRLASDRERFDLYPKDQEIFHFDDGREATIADILQDPAAYHDCSLVDPTDLEERPGKAKFFWNQASEFTEEKFVINLIRSGQTIFLHGEDVEGFGAKAQEEAISDDMDVAAAVNKLAQIPKLDYDRCRVEEAKALGIRVTSLDAGVKTERARAEREQRNQQRKAAEEAGESPTAWIEEFNAKYSTVLYGGKMVVGFADYDEVMEREHWAFLSFKTFREMHIADYGVLGYNAEGEPIRGSKSKWLEMERRVGNRKLYFDPSKPPKLQREDYLNMWTGFTIQGSSAGGDPEPMLRHIHEVICCNDPERIQYVLGWLALLIQQPGYQHAVALVLRGKKGSGKGTLGNLLRKIMGRHALHLTQTKHLTGNFNAHLQDACFVFADEAFFAGDRSNDGPLKGLITEPTMHVEPKGVDSFTARNWMSVMMATNSDWVAPMGADERRYAVMDVSDDRIADRGYFDALVAWAADNSNVMAFIEHMQAYDLSEFDVRAVPETEGLKQQRAHSLPKWAQWWGDALSRGGFGGWSGAEWFGQVSNRYLFDSFGAYLRDRRAPTYDYIPDNALGRIIGPLAGVTKKIAVQKTQPVPNGLAGDWNRAHVLHAEFKDGVDNRVPGRVLGTLEEARSRFIEYYKLPESYFESDLD